MSTSPGSSSTRRISTGRVGAESLTGRDLPLDRRVVRRGRRWHALHRLALDRERERHARAAERRRAQTDRTTVELDDLLRERQADAGALVLVAPVQSLEDHEHLVSVFIGDPDA